MNCVPSYTTSAVWPATSSPPTIAETPNWVRRNRFTAPDDATLSVVGPVLPLPITNRTCRPAVSEKVDGVTDETICAFVPVDAEPTNIVVPPCAGVIGVERADKDVMSLLAPAAAALPRQAMMAL